MTTLLQYEERFVRKHYAAVDPEPLARTDLTEGHKSPVLRTIESLHMRIVSPSPHQAAPQAAQLLLVMQYYCLNVVIFKSNDNIK